MACSSQPLAASVGRDILKAGGNAADAAIAMAAMVSVTEPMMNGLGGDCMILVALERRVFGLNGSGRAGSRLTLDNLRAAGFSSMPQAGAATVTVPGALDGYLALHERFGSMDLSALVEPAAAYAEEGFAVGTKIGQVWEWGASKLRRFSRMLTPYLPGGAPPKPGQIFHQRDLARTWRAIGKNGRDAFYGGEIRDRILGALQKDGGYLVSEDFDEMQAEWVEPIRSRYRGHSILELPPNGQGLVALMALGILEAFDLRRLFVEDEVKANHLILEAVKLAFADATTYVADPRFAATPVDRLLSTEYLDRTSRPDPARPRVGRACRGPYLWRHDLPHGRRPRPQRGVPHHQHIRHIRVRNHRSGNRRDPPQPRRRLRDGPGASQSCARRESACATRSCRR